jgi:DnaJ-class molecular chaperone
MKLAQVCPICSGRGFVQQGFYTTYTGEWTSGNTQSERCKSCDGKGYILINQNNDVEYKVPKKTG